ncbi:MAG: hypothetical protein H6574_05735 [Lewinellaceae bacterium]|nr:hypothetical protein [Saprospiraceae bacterium]MCB9315905.1 hypothetical protein [Lewinellaceae bacterium]MCB9330564.1 hypothetical protein [Lewinellaceae bacterium]
MQAFESDDRLNTQFWLDSLVRLGNAEYTALQWDERWLLYFWLDNYSPLFQEVTWFAIIQETETWNKIPPPPDSLFNRLDLKLFENQAYLFDQIRQAWLSTEERAFASLLLNYLLRLSLEEPAASEFDAQLNGFLKTFPKSKFRSFIIERMYNTKQPGPWSINLDVLFLQSNWSGGLERTLRPLFGVDLGLCYWRKGWNLAARMAAGGQKLDRDVEQNSFYWTAGEKANFLAIELETGFDVINKSRLRIFPSVGGGFSTIHPPQNEDDPNPDYYDNFRFNGWHLSVAIQADIKFNLGAPNVATSYHGVRVRMGHRWLDLDKGNPSMEGNQFFVAVGYTLFGRQALK